MNTLLLAWLMSLLGFAALALAMERHQRYLALGQPGPWMTHGSRLAGILLLSIALGLCVIRWQPSVGTAIWLGGDHLRRSGSGADLRLLHARSLSEAAGCRLVPGWSLDGSVAVTGSQIGE